MKYLLSLLLICFLWTAASPTFHEAKVYKTESVDSFPTPFTNQGSPTTAIKNRGGLFVDSTFRGAVFYDTAQANLSQSKFYGGSEIFTTSDNTKWQRNATATQWLQQSGSTTVVTGVDSVTANTFNHTVCYWKDGIPTCSVLDADSATNRGGLFCYWKNGDSTCVPVTGDVINTGVDSVIVSAGSLCVYVGAVATCYPLPVPTPAFWTNSGVLGDYINTNTGVAIIQPLTTNRAMQWRDNTGTPRMEVAGNILYSPNTIRAYSLNGIEFESGGSVNGALWRFIDGSGTAVPGTSIGTYLSIEGILSNLATGTYTRNLLNVRPSIGNASAGQNDTINGVNFTAPINTTNGNTVIRGFNYQPTVTGNTNLTQYGFRNLNSNNAFNIGSGFSGFGTESPSATADINGTLRIRGNGATTGYVWTATDNLGNGSWQASGGGGNDSITVFLPLRASVTGDSLTIDTVSTTQAGVLSDSQYLNLLTKVDSCVNHGDTMICYANGIAVATTTNPIPYNLLQVTALGDSANHMAFPETVTDTFGVIRFGGHRFIHTYTNSNARFDGLNTFLGYEAGNFTSTGSPATALGGRNIGIGYYALHDNTTGWQNTAIGHISQQHTTSGIYNTSLGAYTLAENTTGLNNTAIGADGLWKNTTGENNTGVGSYVLQQTTTGINNTAVGKDAMILNYTGNHNTAMGVGALQNGNRDYNVAIGYQALKADTTGSQNTAVGSFTLNTNVVGVQNTAIGYGALQTAKGDNNTAIGHSSGDDITTGHENTSIGLSSLGNTTTGSNNTALGYNTGFGNTTGSSNTFIGKGADVLVNNLSNVTVIGSNAKGWVSNTVIIGDTINSVKVGVGVNNPLATLHVSGNNTTSAIFMNGNVGIGTATPDSVTSIVGGIKQTNNYYTAAPTNRMLVWDSVSGGYGHQAIPTGNAGTVTSVGFTGGLISVATATTTPALTVAGTSGGIPYFSSSSTWASSAALAANAIVIGGGAGVAPSTTTTGTGVVTALGVNTGSSGAFVVNGGALGTPSSGTLTNATGLPLTTGVTGTLGVTNGGNGLTTATLGDIRYGSGTNTIAALSGNTTTTLNVLTQTGNGTVSAAPAWLATIGTGNVVRAISPTITGLVTIDSMKVNNLLYWGTSRVATSPINFDPTNTASTGGINFQAGMNFYRSANNQTTLSGSLFNAPGISIAAGAALTFGIRGGIDPSADGVFRFYNNAATGFTRLCLGLATSSFPGLTRSSADLCITDGSGGTASSLGVGNTSVAASAITELTSTTKGFLPPRMTTTQRDAISSPAEGLIIYNTTTHKLNVFTTTWEQITSL